jgi:hypothetical protein
MTDNRIRKIAQAYLDGQKAIDAFDRRDASAQLRCHAISRELERRKEKRSLRGGGSSPDVIDAEFSVAAE